MSLSELNWMEWVVIADVVFLIWMLRPRRKMDYGRSTRASIRNGLQAPFWRDPEIFRRK